MTLKKLTLPELLKNSCSKFSKNLSLNFVASGKKTYQDLYNEVVSIANHLLHLGVKKGDKVAILSANMPNWGITQFAIANIGAIAVPVLPGFCSTELQNILEHAEVKVIFVSRLLAKCLEGVKTPPAFLFSFFVLFCVLLFFFTDLGVGIRVGFGVFVGFWCLAGLGVDIGVDVEA